MLIAGFGRRGHAVGDIPGVRFKVSQSLTPGCAWCSARPKRCLCALTSCVGLPPASVGPAVLRRLHGAQVVKVAGVSLWALFRQKKVGVLAGAAAADAGAARIQCLVLVQEKPRN